MVAICGGNSERDRCVLVKWWVVLWVSDIFDWSGYEVVKLVAAYGEFVECLLDGCVFSLLRQFCFFVIGVEDLVWWRVCIR